MTVITAPPVTQETPRPPEARQGGLDPALAAGLAWTALFRWAAQIVSWFATFYAARLLLPADYGIVAMASLSVGLVRMIEGFGLDSILVQDRALVGERQAQLAGFVFATTFILLGIFWVIAPWIAGFFNEPAVALVVRIMSLVLVLDALQVVPRATLQRTLQFRRLAIVTFVQFVVTSLVLVISAAAGLRHWALVLNTLGGAIAATAMLLVWAPFAVSWPRDLRSIAKPLLQGWRVLASRISWYGYSSADQTIIGRVLGKDLLGAYSFATTLSNIALDEIGSVVGRVTPGILSAVQTQKAELRRYYLLLTELLTIASFPITFGLCVTADLAVPLALGPEWGNAIIPLQLLCVYSAFNSAQTLNSQILMWTGQFRALMYLSMLSLVTMPLILLGAVRFGLPGVAFAWAAIYPIFNIPTYILTFRTIDATIWDVLRSLKPAAAGSLIMGLAVIGVRLMLPDTTGLVVTTVVSVIAGAIAYSATLWFGFRPRLEVQFDLARSLRSRRATVLPADQPL